MRHLLLRRLVARGPLLLSVGLLVLIVSVTYFRAVSLTGGVLVYALDDAYIHMALSKNLALHGILGATPYEFTSASSSPLWTILLAVLFRLFGVWQYTPLIIGFIASVALLVFVDSILVREMTGPAVRLFTLTGLVVATPAVATIFGGMEHPLQALINVGLIAVCTRVLPTGTGGSLDRPTWIVPLLAAAATGIRYEGLLLVGVLASYLLLVRRWRSALMLTAGLVPPLVWGLFSILNGGYALPNPVIIKTSNTAGVGLIEQGPAVWGTALADKLAASNPLGVVLLAAALMVLSLGGRRALDDPRVGFAGVCSTTAALHLVLGDVGWLFRYESYLFVILLVSLAVMSGPFTLRPGQPALWASRVAVLLLIVSLPGMVWRGVQAIRTTPWAMKNVYQQPHQTAHFLQANPEYDCVAINDLGAVSFFNDRIRILDVAGLGQQRPPVELLDDPSPDTDKIVGRSHLKPKLAMLAEDWFAVPDDWVVVARLAIPNDVQVVSPVITVCAVPPTDPDVVRDDLEDFVSSRLPRDVSVTWQTTTPEQADAIVGRTQ